MSQRYTVRFAYLSCIFISLMGVKVYAQDADDESALQLADIAQAPVIVSSNWRTFIEGAEGQITARSSSVQSVQRLSFDTRYDGFISPSLRAVFADRIDLNFPRPSNEYNGVNTLKEAYLSWQVDQSSAWDVGRINLRNGVSSGYNPTDYFKAGALHSVVSVDPISLKENRQGSVMVRGQKLWTGGGLTAIYSPRLATASANAAYGINLGGNNSEHRALFSLSQKIVEGFSPQLLLYLQGNQSPQVGLNLSGLLNDSTVFNVEWSGARMRSQFFEALRSQNLQSEDQTSWRNRLSIGVTHTTENKISLTTEFNYDGSALNKSNWTALRNGPNELYSLYVNWVQVIQEMPTQKSAFLYLTWQDAIIPRLDLTAMQRYDLVDSSRMDWLEARYHTLQRSEFALQWQRNRGSYLSSYGALPAKQSVLLLARYFF